MRKYICRKCGDTFTPDKETQELIEEGALTHLPDVCDDCFDLSEQAPEIDEYRGDNDNL